MSSHRIAALATLLAGGLSYACAPNSGSSGPGLASGGGTAASGGATASGGQVNGNGGESNGTGGFGISTIPGSNRDASTGDASCAESVYEPETVTVTTEIPVEINCVADAPQPLSLYIMLDNSGSMSDNNKWTDAVTAITQFVNSDPTATGTWACTDKDGKSVPVPSTLAPPGSGSISVAIQYFNTGTGRNQPNLCDGVAHSTPAVPMAPIPGNGPAIVNSLAGTGPSGNTPTVGALTGGTAYCTAYQAANPGKKCVLVFVTDGQPNGCGLSSSCGGFLDPNDCVDANAASTLTPIASTAFNTSGVLTFTLGMNGVNAAGFALLNQIAVAGGSNCNPGSTGNEACNLTTGGSQAFLNALNTIRKTVQVTNTSSQTVTTTTTQSTTLPCEFTIPQPSGGQVFDQNRVNVKFTTGGVAAELGNVSAKADCPASGGWYYDNVANPTSILACPSTCAAIQAKGDAQASAQLQILVGCATVPATLN
jgi:hypothetical protein